MQRISQTLARLTSRSSKRRNTDINSPSSDNALDTARALPTVGTAHTSASDSSTTSLSGLHLDERDSNWGCCFLHGHDQATPDGVDIVFVHGLNGHRVTSWEKGDVCWPRDLLGGDMPNIRVISWGWSLTPQYDKLDELAEQSSLGDQLLDDLFRLRKKHGGEERPIVFVGHGNGGMVIKEAITTAAVARIYGNDAAAEKGEVYAKTIGVVFLGATHVAAPGLTLGETIAQNSRLSPHLPEPKFFDFCVEQSAFFEKVAEDFALFSRDIQVVCIREDKATSNGLMVSKHSAFYEGGPNITVDSVLADHFGIVQFQKRTDPGYFQMLGHLSKLTQGNALSRRCRVLYRNDLTLTKLQNSLRPKSKEAGVGSCSILNLAFQFANVRRPDILDMLYFDSMFERSEQITVEDEHRPVFSQILAQKNNEELESPFYKWLESDESLCWVSGNEGTAKSTLMKYIPYDTEVKRRLDRWANGKLLMAQVFLFGEGSQLQMDHEGLLRTILFQILNDRKDLIPAAFPTFYGGPWPPLVPLNSIVNLTQAGFALIAKQNKLVIFVDGVENYRCYQASQHDEIASESASEQSESEEETGNESGGKNVPSAKKQWLMESHREIATLMTSLGANPRGKICVSSRELPVFEAAFGNAPRIRMHTQSDKAIIRYCAARLAESAPGMNLADLCQAVASKANGNILWARLAINVLLEQSLKMLRPTLDRLPTKLSGCKGLYMHILQRLPVDRQQDAARMFQLMHRTQKIQPPSAMTMALARRGYLNENGELLVETDRARLKSPEEIKESCEQILRRLHDCCPSLFVYEGKPLEPNQRILFAHSTVRLFAARKDVWNQLLGDAEGYIRGDGPIDIDLSLMSGCIRQLQYFRPGMLRPFLHVHSFSRVQIVPEAWLTIITALRYAARIDKELRPDDALRRSHYLGLLDHLDSFCQQAWVDSLHNYRPLFQDTDWFVSQIPILRNKHWSGFEPMETGKPPKRKSFLSLAIQANLVTYVAAAVERLKNSSDTNLGKTFEQLLEAAVSTPTDVGDPACRTLASEYRGFHSELPCTTLAETVLRAGRSHIDLRARTSAGCPNKIWMRALQTRHRWFSPQSRSRQTGVSRLLGEGNPAALARNQERWVAAIRLLLAAGADPNAAIPVADRTKANKSGAGSDGGPETRNAADIIMETLAAEPGFAEDLDDIKVFMGDSRGEQRGA